MPEKLTDFRQLNVWQKAHKLVLDVYEITRKYPKDEKTEMVSNIRNHACSIPILIAQGFMSRSPRDKSVFYKGTLESLEALKYYLILSKDLDYIKNTEELMLAVEEVGRMLTGLVRSVRSDSPGRGSGRNS